MGLDLGGIIKAAVPLAATAFGGPIAGAAAGALFGGGGAKGGAEGVNQLTSLFGAGGGKPPGLTGMQPDLAKQALSLFKDASTPEQKNKLLDLAIFALGGDPGQRGGMTSLSSPGGMPAAGANAGASPNGQAPNADGKQGVHHHHHHHGHHGVEHKGTQAHTGSNGANASTNGSNGTASKGPASSTGASSNTAATSGTTPSSSNGSSAPLTVSGNKVDTGRYEISASTDKDGQVKILDKQTNTFVEAFGDPHLRASDGNQASFQKNGLSIKLPDGTAVHLKPTATNDKGVSWLQGAMVEKDGKAVTMTGMHEPGGVKTSDVKTTTDDMVHDFTTQGQTVLDASEKDVGDLFMTGPDGQRTTELNSKDHETSLDGMGGALHTKDDDVDADNDNDADAAKGSEFKVDSGLLDKLSQTLHLTATNVGDRSTQQGLLSGIQDVLKTFITPAAA